MGSQVDLGWLRRPENCYSFTNGSIHLSYSNFNTTMTKSYSKQLNSWKRADSRAASWTKRTAKMGTKCGDRDENKLTMWYAAHFWTQLRIDRRLRVRSAHIRYWAPVRSKNGASWRPED